MKVIVLKAAQGDAIWSALNPRRPEITTYLCGGDEIGAYLATPGACQVLAAPQLWWQGLSPAARSRVRSRLQLLCLYDSGEADGRADPEGDGCPILRFAPSQALPQMLAGVLGWVAGGNSLGEAPAVMAGQAWCAQAARAWHLAQNQAAGERPKILAADEPKSTPPAAPQQSGIYIANIHIKASERQPVQLTSHGQTTIVQHTTGDQVNINKISGGETPAIRQSAGSDQVNINRVGSEPTQTVATPEVCRVCGTRPQPGTEFCLNCGAGWEAE